jgi:hypothetical protein
MTYEEAMTAVKENLAARVDRRPYGAKTAARRASWATDPDKCREAVIYFEVYVPTGNNLAMKSQMTLLLNTFSSEDPADWGLDACAGSWRPSAEDKQATDWEVYELWS